MRYRGVWETSVMLTGANTQGSLSLSAGKEQTPNQGTHACKMQNTHARTCCCGRGPGSEVGEGQSVLAVEGEAGAVGLVGLVVCETGRDHQRAGGL